MSDPTLRRPDAAPLITPGLVVYKVKPLQHKVYLALEDALRPLEVSAAQFRLMGAIAGQQKASAAELARLFGVSPQSMNKQIAALEAKGLVARTVRENNRRALELELTEEGESLIRACDAVSLQLEEQLLAGFSRDERKLFREFLGRALMAGPFRRGS